jgi:NAD(P)-dependent dehydrogenase (short-subunit alcohol dehydrogenase family)
MKTFLSVGAGPGMSFATAERFAKEGFQVVLAARNAAKIQVLAEKLKSKGYKAEVHKVDSGDPACVTELVAGVEKHHGPSTSCTTTPLPCARPPSPSNRATPLTAIWQ